MTSAPHARHLEAARALLDRLWLGPDMSTMRIRLAQALAAAEREGAERMRERAARLAERGEGFDWKGELASKALCEAAAAIRALASEEDRNA